MTSDDTLEFTNTKSPTEFSFYVDSEELLTFEKDGKLRKGPAFTTDDEATHRFLKILEDCYPDFFKEKKEERRVAENWWDLFVVEEITLGDGSVQYEAHERRTRDGFLLGQAGFVGRFATVAALKKGLWDHYQEMEVKRKEVEFTSLHEERGVVREEDLNLERFKG